MIDQTGRGSAVDLRPYTVPQPFWCWMDASDPALAEFDQLPVNCTVIEHARKVAKLGRTVEAMDRLTELKQADPGLDCDFQALIDLSKAEGLLLTARTSAQREGKERTRAIELFRAAKLLIPGSSLEAELEADRYEALDMIAKLDELINEEVEKIRNTPNPQSYSRLPLGDPAAASSGIRFADAKKRFDRLKDLNKRNPPRLFVEIVRVGGRLKAWSSTRRLGNWPAMSMG